MPKTKLDSEKRFLMFSKRVNHRLDMMQETIDIRDNEIASMTRKINDMEKLLNPDWNVSDFRIAVKRTRKLLVVPQEEQGIIRQ